MDIGNAIYGRKSIRVFQDIPVEKETLSEIIKAAIYAPSASNKQGWKFIHINDCQLKEKICENNGGGMPVAHRLIMNSPTGVLVLYRKDMSRNSFLYKDHIQSASAAIQNMLLRAYSLGIGTCWICKLPEPKYLRKLLNIPNYYDIIGYVAMGYPKEEIDEITARHYEGNKLLASKRPRKYNVDEVLCYNQFIEHKIAGELKYIKTLYFLQWFQLKIKNDKKNAILKGLLNKLIVKLEASYK